MKKTNCFSLLECLLILCILFLLACFVPKANADSQGYASTYLNLPSVPVVMTNGVVSSNNYVPLRLTSGLGLQIVVQGSNAVTGPVTVWAYPSVDGTNAITPFLNSVTATASGTNIVVAGTNYNSFQLRGYTGLFFTVSNGTGGNVTMNGPVTNGVTGAVSAGGVTLNRSNQ